jgi:Trk K+ transport system NAD-binding subunit
MQKLNGPYILAAMVTLSNIQTEPVLATPERLPTSHIVLCGLGGLGLRTLEELHSLGEDIVVVAHEPTPTFALKAQAMDAILVPGDYREEAVLKAAGVESARAIILTEKDDIGNLHAGLIAQDLNPEALIIIHMFDIELGEQVRALIQKCEVLSSSAIAAPAFIAAALHLDWEQKIDVAGHSLIVRAGKGKGRVWGKDKGIVSIGAIARDPHTLMHLACIKGDGTASLFPDVDPRPGASSLEPSAGEVCEDVVFLVDGGESPQALGHDNPPNRSRFDPRGMLRSARLLFMAADLRLRRLMAVLLVLLLVSSVIFSVFQGLSPLDAFYFTVSTITTTGFGDISFINSHPALKAYGIFLMLLGAASLAILYALITDVLVGARLGGGIPADTERLRDHVVVCGLGNIGYRVVEKLATMNVPVAACELDGSSRYLPTVRQLAVPALVADARVPQTLRSLGIERARCLVAAIDDDRANLQTALTARRLNPNLRVVLRIFDPDLAARVEHSFEIEISRSPAALTAPALVAAAVGGRVIDTIQVADQVVFITHTTVDAGSAADGDTVACLEEAAESEGGGIECRVLLLNDNGRQVWAPSRDTPLRAGYELVIVVSQHKLAHVLSITNPGPSGE